MRPSTPPLLGKTPVTLSTKPPISRKPKQVVLAVMRKLLNQICGVLTSGQLYDPGSPLELTGRTLEVTVGG